MAFQTEQILTGVVARVGVIALVVERIVTRVRQHKMNGVAPGYIEDIKGMMRIYANKIDDLADKAAENHEGIQVIKTSLDKFEKSCGQHQVAQDKLNGAVATHLSVLDDKVYELAKTSSRKVR